DPDLASHHKRPHLADFAFPIAASRLGLDVDVLDVSWNFPSWAWTLEGRQTPYLFHYQSWSRLRAEEGCRAAITRSANILPSVRRALASFPQP
ncbi:MAG TPA: hypothetical protein VJP88_11605, partial [Caulobacteraceae bacterium]|nr:hypothetical protein [Caulobacteraceae bacterium]